MTTKTFAQIIILGGLIALVLACITAAAIVTGPDWLPGVQSPAETPVAAKQFTPQPTFTATATPKPPSPTSPPSPSPSVTPLPETATAIPTFTPEPSATPTEPPLAVVTDTPLPPPNPPTATRPAVDFIVTQQRLLSNEENSRNGKTANECGADHTIYIAVVDAAGSPLSDVLVQDTYDNVRAVSGSAGLGKLKIDLWSNTMSLIIKQNTNDEPYSSEQTLPLSAHDEEIPAQWLLEGGYCPSLAECELRQQTNGLCRGHYSYEVTFQRTW